MARCTRLHGTQEVILAQYSIPFCVATALGGDQPIRAFRRRGDSRPVVRAMARQGRGARDGGGGGWATTTRIERPDGGASTRTSRSPRHPPRCHERHRREQKIMRLTAGSAPRPGPLCAAEQIERERRSTGWAPARPSPSGLNAPRRRVGVKVRRAAALRVARSSSAAGFRASAHGTV